MVAEGNLLLPPDHLGASLSSELISPLIRLDSFTIRSGLSNYYSPRSAVWFWESATSNISHMR